MKKLMIICCSLLLVVKVSAQMLNVDSLVNVLETKKLTVEEQLNIYWDLCQFYTKNDIEKLKMYAKNGINLAKNNKLMESRFNEYLGVGYLYEGKYDSAFVYCNKAQTLAIEAKDQKRELSVIITIGGIYYNQGRYDLLLENLFKALSLSELTDNKNQYAKTLRNIGSTYNNLGDTAKAILYQEKAKETIEKYNLKNQQMDVYYELGKIYHSQKKYNEAMDYLQKALDICITTHNRQYEAYCRLSLANLYAEGLKDYSQGEQQANEALQLADKIGDNYLLNNAKITLAGIYFFQSRYKDTENLSLSVWESDSTNYTSGRYATLYITLANAFLGNKDKMFTFYEKYGRIMDQYIHDTSLEKLHNLETKYETEKKEMRIVALEKERRLYSRLGIAVGLLVISMGIALLQTIRNSRKEKQLIATKAVQDGEMNERSRIAEDLHDRLGGSLSAVKIELHTAESLQNVSDKLDECIKEVREITHNLMPRSLRQSGIKTALEDFTAQFPNVRFHFFGEEKRFKERLEFIIYCCANELVTNSLRYSKAENINVQLIQSEKHVSLTVQDDGCGFDENTVTPGIGLKNIRDRVASCNGKLDMVSSKEKGTETTIELRVES